MTDLYSQIEALELAVLALARAEFGDIEGHTFHGNQYSNGGGEIKVGHTVSLKSERGEWVVKETDRKPSGGGNPVLVVGKKDRSDYDYLKTAADVVGRIHTAEVGSATHEKLTRGELPKGDKVKLVDSQGGRVKTVTAAGDVEGHPFRGNQWSSGGGKSSAIEDRAKNRDPLAYKGAKPEPKPAPVQAPKPPKPLTDSQIDRGVKKARKDLEVAIKDTLRDNPNMHADEIARDLAESVSIGMHPDVKKAFYQGEGFDFRPNELRGLAGLPGRHGFSAEEFGDSSGHPFHGNQYTSGQDVSAERGSSGMGDAARVVKDNGETVTVKFHDPSLGTNGQFDVPRNQVSPLMENADSVLAHIAAHGEAPAIVDDASLKAQQDAKQRVANEKQEVIDAYHKAMDRGAHGDVAQRIADRKLGPLNEQSQALDKAYYASPIGKWIASFERQPSGKPPAGFTYNGVRG